MAQQQPSQDTLGIESRNPEIAKSFFKKRKKARLICIEEQSLVPSNIQLASSMIITSHFRDVEKRIDDTDFRLQTMDANNISAQIVSLTTPDAQGITDLNKSQNFCQQGNEFIYQNYMLKHPMRFFGFAALPTQDGDAAAAELERCVREYGFVGAVVNGFTSTTDDGRGLYLDDRQFDVLWEVAQRLQKPIFIQPRVPLASKLQNIHDLPVLRKTPNKFSNDTVEHALRFMCTGVFDRFPQLKIILGHMGEELSWILPKGDTLFRTYTPGAKFPKKRTFLDYFQDNIFIVASGAPRTSAFMNLMAETKVSNILLSVEHPYKSISELQKWFDTIPVSDETWEDIGYRNAIRLFGLPLEYDA